MKTLRVIAFIVASLVLGDVIARYLANLSIDAPNIDRGTQWAIGLFNPAAATNPDAVFDVGTIIIGIASTIFAGVVIYAIWRVLRSIYRRRTMP